MDRRRATGYLRKRLDDARRRAMSRATVHVVAHVMAQPGKEERLRTALLAMVQPSRQEEGCISYEVLQNSREPREFLVVQEWASEEHHQTHVKSEHFYDLMSQMDNLNLIVEAPELRFYRLLT